MRCVGQRRRIALLAAIPEDTAIGTVDDFMFKEGVKDILEKVRTRPRLWRLAARRGQRATRQARG